MFKLILLCAGDPIKKGVEQGIWLSFRNGIFVGLIGGLTYGLILWLIYGVIGGLIHLEMVRQIHGEFGLPIGRHNLFVTIFQMIVSLIFGLIFGLALGLILGLIFGVIGGLMTGIKYCILRLLLFKNGYIPWNYSLFLDHATQHRFIQRLGKRYRFMHDLLRKQFAIMPLDKHELKKFLNEESLTEKNKLL